MAGYSPMKITGMETGLVQNREEFILPNDAYPVLQNAYVWRERIHRKDGCQLIGRLQRNIGTTDGAGNLTVTITPNPIQIGISFFTVGSATFTDPGGTSPVTLLTNGPGTATLNRTTGVLTILASNAGTSVQYYPGLPAMGCRTRERVSPQPDQTVFFDTEYAYIFDGSTRAFKEFIPGTTWSGSDSNFFWTTNFWVDTTNVKIFWATNNFDSIRYTNGTSWVNFTPTIDKGSGTVLNNALILMPFRGRLVAFNTTENSLTYTNRIRWAAIGTPFTTVGAIPVNVNSQAWFDDVRGQGGFLDIPTSQDIVSVGFVRDNLVIYCENSTWQLRYTGRSIAPFQIEKVNSELGMLSTFGAIQFDTSLVGIGDKGIVECDSYTSNLIDVKIPDLVFNLQNLNSGQTRVHGIRDFESRLAYWIYPSADTNGTYPDSRLVYNYENDSWSIFSDSYTCLGTFQEPSSRTWLNTHEPWIKCNFSWINQPALIPAIVAGNQQGFIEQIEQFDGPNTNDVSLFISAITSNGTTATQITSHNHNLQTGVVIEIYSIPAASPYSNLNYSDTTPYDVYNNVFSIIVNSANTFLLMKYNPATGIFDQAQLDASQTYQGGGLIAIRDNFVIQSKKFNFIDEGQSIQMGYLDILMDTTGNDGQPNVGAISLNVYLNYNIDESINMIPQNNKNHNGNPTPDTFFNSIIPTTQSSLSNIGGTKFWQRVYCPTRANFLTLQYTFSNDQMARIQQNTDVQIDAQVLWVRKGGRLTQI